MPYKLINFCILYLSQTICALAIVPNITIPASFENNPLFISIDILLNIIIQIFYKNFVDNNLYINI